MSSHERPTFAGGPGFRREGSAEVLTDSDPDRADAAREEANRPCGGFGEVVFASGDIRTTVNYTHQDARSRAVEADPDLCPAR